MNRNHFQKMPFSVKAALAVLIATTCISHSNAQDMLPLAAPSGVNGLAPAEPAFQLPAGASIGDANEKIKKLSNEGAQSLKDLVGAAVNNDREKNDVEARSQDKREIENLKLSLEKAKLAKELFEVINGDKDKNEKELETVRLERDELSIRIKSLEDQLIASNKLISSQSMNKAPNPVIVSIVGSNGDLTAKVLIPYYGETTVRTGDILANGQKVESISSSKVTVSQDGETKTLSFGTSVPAAPRG